MKVHWPYGNRSTGYAACGIYSGISRLATDPAAVTCGNCKRIMRPRAPLNPASLDDAIDDYLDKFRQIARERLIDRAVRWWHRKAAGGLSVAECPNCRIGVAPDTTSLGFIRSEFARLNAEERG